MKIKKIFALLIMAASTATAFAGPDGLLLTDRQINFSDNTIEASVTIDGSALKLKSNEEILVEPMIHLNDGSIYKMTPVVFLGHNRKVQAERNTKAFSGMILSGAGKNVTVNGSFPLTTEMISGEVSAMITQRGCCRRDKAEENLIVDNFDIPRKWEFSPQFAFIAPQSEGPKNRNLSGKAFVDFKVNRTEIDPNFRQNPRELAAIDKTINEVVSDPDVTVKQIIFTGYASPEGSYANNARLAKGRTEALRDYVARKHHFSPSILKASSVAEDWEGLREAVEKSSYPDKNELLAIITDSSLEPDARERKLAQKYPSAYKVLLNEIYPGLRHSDYVIDYEIKTYDDPVEILRLLETAPQKLSLREMFVAANTLQPGTEQYNRVFKTAARMFPDSEIANLNAAVIDLQNGQYDEARYFLSHAGETPEAVYTRGLLAVYDQDFTTARELLTKARDMGIQEATDALGQLDKKPKIIKK